MDHQWMKDANCLDADPDLFFPERGKKFTEAKAICSECVVRLDCLEYALENNQYHGVWGGTTEKERRRINRSRRRDNK